MTHKMLLPVLVIIAAAMLGAGGCASQADSTGDAAAEFPSFVYAASAPKDTPIAYQTAVDFGEDMKQIPCYCGCGSRNIGHDSLLDCFIAGPDERGSIADGYSSHGASCNLCVLEALDVLQAKQEGTPIHDIRSAIDSKYGGGRYAGPTPTPQV